MLGAGYAKKHKRDIVLALTDLIGYRHWTNKHTNKYIITNRIAIKGKLEGFVREHKGIYYSLGDEGHLDQDLDWVSEKSLPGE